MTLHLADDIARGMAPRGLLNFAAMIVAVVWLYGTVVLGERRSGQVIILVGSLFDAWVATLHMRGVGLGAGRNGGLFFVWTCLAISATSMFSLVLSAQSLLRGGSR
ncbi:MAG TPA: hypothetical protein VGJ29_05130 [Vicinamibacterales bacterium]